MVTKTILDNSPLNQLQLREWLQPGNDYSSGPEREAIAYLYYHCCSLTVIAHVPLGLGRWVPFIV